MSSAEEIYRVALQELANSGNERAQLALAMTQKLVTTDMSIMKERVGRELRQANEFLQRALLANEDEWTRTTDRRIYDAQNSILLAMEALSR